MDYRHLDDEALVALVRGGQQDALAVLYERYARQVYSLAFYLLQDPAQAEEVTQEVFLNLWRRADTYNPARGRVGTWVMSMAHHRAVDYLRRRRRSAPLEPEMDPERTPSSAPSADEVLMREDLAREVRAALARLPPDQRQVVVMAYYQGYTQSEIARLLGIPLGTVKTRMRLALQKLRDFLGSGREAER